MSVNEVVEGEFQATHSLFFLSLEDKKIQRLKMFGRRKVRLLT